MNTRTISDEELDALLLASTPYAADRAPAAARPLGPHYASARRSLRTRWIAPVLAVATTAVIAVGAVLVAAPPTTAPATSISAEDEARSGAWAVAISEAQERATSDFERQVFSDGILTQDDYDAAMNRFFGCLGDRGYDVVPDRQTNGLLVYGIAGAGQESAVDACAEGTAAQIEPLYSAMVENPGNTPTDADVAHARCLVEAGFVEAPYSARQFRDDSASIEFRRRAMVEAPACFNVP